MIVSVENLEHKLKHGYEKYLYSWEKKALVYLFFTFSWFFFFYSFSFLAFPTCHGLLLLFRFY